MKMMYRVIYKDGSVGAWNFNKEWIEKFAASHFNSILRIETKKYHPF